MGLVRVILVILLVLLAAPAMAILPPGTLVVTRAENVAAGSLPRLLNLDSGTHSALELTEAFALAPTHSADALLAYRVGDSMATTVDPTQFVPPSSRARFFDPELGDTRPAAVLAAAIAGESARIEVDGQVMTLTDALSSLGAALVFTAQPVPEPACGLGLALGGLALAGFGRARR